MATEKSCKMEKCLDTSTYFDKLIITSEAFNNVSYEIKGDAIQLLVWLHGAKDPIKLPMRFGDCLVLCDEMSEIVREWRYL